MRRDGMNSIEQQMLVGERLLSSLFKTANILSLIISGPPGFGKTALVRKVCEQHEIDWSPVRASAKGLVEHCHGLYLAGDKSPMIDYDSALVDSALLELFKILLD